MISASFVRTMVAYGCWQNDHQTKAADELTDAARRADRGAFFGSIAGTLNHLLWGDRIWLSRLAGTPVPTAPSIAASIEETPDWPSYRAGREATDRHFETWAAGLTDTDLGGEMRWMSGAAGREVSRPKAMIVAHVLNHQTHHRGQVHAMLTAAGADPGDTDLFYMDPVA